METPLTVLTASPDGAHVVAALSSHVVVLEAATGAVVHSATLGGHVRAAALHCAPGRRLLATGSDDKTVRVCSLGAEAAAKTDEIVSTRLPKRITGVAFSPDARAVLVSDKFGDVFSLAVEGEAAEKKIKEDDDRDCVVGHCSLITCLAMSPSGAYVATGDRDERVRVSHYPRTYDIASFCLGHTQFIAGAVFAGDRWLCTGAADGSLRVWDAADGRCVSTERPAGDEAAVVVPCAYWAASRELAVRVEGASSAWVYVVDEATGALSLARKEATHAAPLCLAFVAGGALVAGFASSPVAAVVGAASEAAGRLAEAIVASAPKCTEQQAASVAKAYAMEPMRKRQGAGGDDDDGEGEGDDAAPEPESKRPKTDD
eukprot:m51a1_g8974 putative wd40 repeat-like protein (373) ;mRNA; f:29338-30456